MAFYQRSIFLVVLCMVCYYKSLKGDFVFDDIVAITKNKDVTSQDTKIQDIFSHDFWGYNITDPTSHKSYRPLTILMFNMEHNLFNDLNSFYMKCVNLFIHCVNTVLVLKLFTLLISTVELSFIAAILFAVHPVHTEAVCGIVGRAELMFAFFFIITLIIYSNPCFGIQSNFALLHKYILLIIISAIALLFKENAISILPTCVLFDLTVRTNLFQRFENRFRVRRKILHRCIVLIVITCILLICRLYIQNFEQPIFKPMDNPIAFNNSLITRIISQHYLYVLNTWILLCPHWLSFDWALGCIQLIDSIFDVRSLTIVIFWTFMYFLLLKSSRIVLLATILITVPFLPAAGILKVGFVIAERILYVPSIGFCLLISIGFGYLVDKYHNLKQVLYFALILLVLTFILRTIQRSEEWKSGEKLFTSALKVCPNNAKVHYNIARIATDEGDKNKALKHYHRAIELYPNYEAALMNLGNLYKDIGDFHTAELYLKKSIEVLENFPTAWMNLGIVQAAMKKYQEAEYSYNKALSYRKNYFTCLYNLGNLYLEMKNYSFAMKYWHESVSINPKFKKAWLNILTLLDNRNLYEDALAISERAEKYLSNDTSILFIKANILGKLKKYSEAEQLYLQIIQMNPNNSVYQSNLGVLYHRWNKSEIDVKYYQNALSLDPQNKNARYNLNKLRDFQII